MKILILLPIFILSLITLKAENKVFADEDGDVKLELPSEWFLKNIDDEKVMQMFISMEKVVEPEDMFTVGATINKIRRMSKTYEQMKDDAAIVNIWYSVNRSLMEEKYLQYEELRRDVLEIDGYQGVISEIRFQATENDFVVRMYSLILAKEDTLVTVIMETPDDKWDEYIDIYNNALKTLEIK